LLIYQLAGLGIGVICNKIRHFYGLAGRRRRGKKGRDACAYGSIDPKIQANAQNYQAQHGQPQPPLPAPSARFAQPFGNGAKHLRAQFSTRPLRF
jgi:hypothetical protein